MWPNENTKGEINKICRGFKELRQPMPNLALSICLKMTILTNSYVCSSCKLITKNEFLASIHSLDFALNIHIAKIVQFHIS